MFSFMPPLPLVLTIVVLEKHPHPLKQLNRPDPFSPSPRQNFSSFVVFQMQVCFSGDTLEFGVVI